MTVNQHNLLIMTASQNQKEHLERQFQELAEKAKAIYPNIDEAVGLLNNNTAQTINLQDYLNLTTQTPTDRDNYESNLLHVMPTWGQILGEIRKQIQSGDVQAFDTIRNH